MLGKRLFLADSTRITGDDTLQSACICKTESGLQTIGGLFGDIFSGVHELTVVEKIWAIILEVMAVVAELTDADEEVLMRLIIENDRRLAALRAYAQAA